jgi:photosystem II stability/assembly factor-like uncharacterized protein
MQNRLFGSYPTIARFRTGLLMLAALAIAGGVTMLAGTITGVVAIEPRPAAAASGLARYVAERNPVQGHGQAQQELSAWRPVTGQASGGRVPAASTPYTNPWQLQATLPGAVIKDISFPTPQVGYVAAELGQVWKTTDGGAHWSRIMNLGFPYYWYGVQALDASNVVISGFINNAMSGVIRWSQDGGTTWSPDIALTTRGWSYRVRFADATHGLVLDGLNYDGPNAAHYTTNGGHTAGDWTPVVPDPAGGWFGNQFSLLSSLKARATGITYCTSLNLGAAWSCRPSIDSVFDGPVFFANDLHGWVGGGSISPSVEGWVHRTTDGGTTWSPRTLDNPWPIRELRFVSDQVGWAAGGNIYSQVGGMYFSSDGGQTWSLDASTGAEMDACDSVATEYGPQVWCAGYTSAFNGLVYTLIPQAATPTPTVMATATTASTSTATSTATASTSTTTSTAIPTSSATSSATATPTNVATLVATYSPTRTATPCAISFSDVHLDDYFYEPVRYLYCHGVISGYGDNTFRPGNLTTRGQLAKIAVLAIGWTIYTPSNPTFRDVPATNPFYAHIETAYSHGIISGYACGPGCLEFRPGNNVTRGQLCKIVVLARGWTPYAPPTPTFQDVPNTNPFYEQVETAYSHGIISGYSCGTGCLEFRPGNNATRGQISKIVYLAVTQP